MADAVALQDGRPFSSLGHIGRLGRGVVIKVRTRLPRDMLVPLHFGDAFLKMLRYAVSGTIIDSDTAPGLHS